MDFSKLSQNDRITLGAGAVVVVTALLSITNEWGALMFLSLAAGSGAIALVLQPFFAPAVTLPVTKAMALFGIGAIATIATGLSGLNWLGWIIEHPLRFDTIQFLTGLAAAVVLLVIGFQAFQAERSAAIKPAA
ncbi:MAG TPA: hypothetical protein VFV72_13355 [Candidatus Limnocylindrales bacterium]|nr:hypothetical protein [Candidatus Limnocylindrales bacterium]